MSGEYQWVNVPAARREHERRYEAERLMRAGFRLREPEPDERVSIPLPCGCLVPVGDEHKRSTFLIERRCDCGTKWRIERKGGIRVQKIEDEEGRSRWATRR